MPVWGACYSTWFVAGHSIGGHTGPCRKPHGHNYTVTVCVEAEQLGDDGMVMDYYDLRRIVDEVLGRLDHEWLNSVVGEPPTSERLAEYIYRQVSYKLPPRLKLVRVEVGETPDFKVYYKP